MEFLQTDMFLFVMLIGEIILLMCFGILIVKFYNVQKKYKVFLNKLGNGKDIYEDLDNYLYRVERVEKQNLKITEGINLLQQDLDTGSDLSFALALLDENNNGVVLNGIYSREMSNIYAKPVENGASSYTVSEEEKQAIEKAIASNKIIRLE